MFDTTLDKMEGIIAKQDERIEELEQLEADNEQMRELLQRWHDWNDVLPRIDTISAWHNLGGSILIDTCNLLDK